MKTLVEEFMESDQNVLGVKAWAWTASGCLRLQYARPPHYRTAFAPERTQMLTAGTLAKAPGGNYYWLPADAPNLPEKKLTLNDRRVEEGVFAMNIDGWREVPESQSVEHKRGRFDVRESEARKNGKLFLGSNGTYYYGPDANRAPEPQPQADPAPQPQPTTKCATKLRNWGVKTILGDTHQIIGETSDGTPFFTARIVDRHKTLVRDNNGDVFVLVGPELEWSSSE